MSYKGWEDWEAGKCEGCPGNRNHLPKHITDSYWRSPWIFGKSYSDEVFRAAWLLAGEAASGHRGPDGFAHLGATSPAVLVSRPAPRWTVASTMTPQGRINKAGSESRIDMPP